MDLEIRTLGRTMEKLLEGSRLPPEVKRLILSELLSKVTAESQEAVMEQAEQIRHKEVEQDAESV